MEKDLPLKLERETLLQLAIEQLVDIIVDQAIVNPRYRGLEQRHTNQ
ncbi:hypothetical protein [uncultured Nostoc sp.]